MSYLALDMPLAEFFSVEYKTQFEYFDTFLYKSNFVKRNFNYNGKTYTGGEVNYLGVGVLAGRYNHSSFMLAHMVAAWNIDQYFDNKGSYNLRQISSGFAWANNGRKNFNSGK